ncbi:HpcH/HpaI aldolase/citrate lyase family protein [Ornithinimicrobium tianjinense]|uniref:Citryl-CoA lyase n=1 Tax=Ornithinimicrobium tianjinense TaxID=1195761 RepID=A0A917F2V4_9MICO|nr:CoA ester lyase [Ornithinimicrobium tianjinense]GGF39411.1 citryl-CoA lyase [Ornithinimicrobium tianjinense]
MTSLEQVQGARSFLFVPGDRPERFDKAAAAGADLVIVDLEDAVVAEHKRAARDAVVAWLTDGGSACVRVNAAGSPEHEDDVAALAGASGLVAVVLPKADDPALADAVSARCGVPVVALVESAAGMLRAAELARAEGVARLAFGHLDYAVDLGADNGRTAMLHGRSTLVLASRGAGLPGPVDGVTVTLDDPAVLAEDLAHARELGFTGKLLIHPRQVEGTHAAYRPSSDEVAWAEKVLSAVSDTDGGAVRVDGDMVDAPVIARARDVLRRKDR